MSSQKPILGDHKRIKSKLITPFNDQLGPLREVSWVNTMIPELLWIALLQNAYGPHRCVEILTAFSRDLRTSSPERADTIWAAAGKFSVLPAAELRSLVQKNDAEYGQELRVALRPIAALYPPHPLNKIFLAEDLTPRPDDIELVKRVLVEMYDRSSWGATMTQAHAIWLAFDSGRLVVSPDVSLARFPEIDQYPHTDLSRRIAGAIRASLNQFFGDEGLMASGTTWPVEFWNEGLNLASCEVADGIS